MLMRALRTPVRPEAHVISFGNLTAGGTGKTPAVIECARQKLREGARVAVLTRGYGARRSDAPMVAGPGTPVTPELAASLGDEPALILRRAPGVVVVRHPDRVLAGRRAIELGCDTLILDDGYQYLRLARDENILLIDATNPFGNGRLLPRGILREPVNAVARADRIYLTRCDLAGCAKREALEVWCAQHAPQARLRLTCHEPDALWRVCDGQELPLDTLQGAPLRLVCAIGNPEAFKTTVAKLGATINGCRVLPDHASIPPEVLEGEGMVVVTEKDAVRMVDPPNNVYALGITLAEFRPSI
jgi:tetraacyldisaccharide 4'-kinase